MIWYSLISAVPSTGTDERVHLALFVRSDEDGMVYVSEKRLRGIANLMPDENARAARTIVRDIQKRWEKELKKGAFVPLLEEFSAGRFEYLSKYSNNILSYSTPNAISLPLSTELYEELVGRFFNEKPVATRPRSSHKFSAYATRFFTQFKTVANLNYEIKLSDLSTLAAPVRIDLIGKNKMPYISQSIDFTNTVNTIAQKAKDLQALHHAFQDHGEKPMIHVLSEEPPRNTEQHSYWQRIRDLNYLHIIPRAEDERITAYIREHGVSFFRT